MPLHYFIHIPREPLASRDSIENPSPMFLPSYSHTIILSPVTVMFLSTARAEWCSCDAYGVGRRNEGNEREGEGRGREKRKGQRKKPKQMSLTLSFRV